MWIRAALSVASLSLLGLLNGSARGETLAADFEAPATPTSVSKLGIWRDLYLGISKDQAVKLYPWCTPDLDGVCSKKFSEGVVHRLRFRFVEEKLWAIGIHVDDFGYLDAMKKKYGSPKKVTRPSRCNALAGALAVISPLDRDELVKRHSRHLWWEDGDVVISACVISSAGRQLFFRSVNAAALQATLDFEDGDAVEFAPPGVDSPFEKSAADRYKRLGAKYRGTL